MAFETYKYKNHLKVEYEGDNHNRVQNIHHIIPSTSHSQNDFNQQQNNGQSQFQCVTCEKLFYMAQLHSSYQNGVIKYYCFDCVDKLTEDFMKPGEKLVQTYSCQQCVSCMRTVSNSSTCRLALSIQPFHCDLCAKKLTEYPPPDTNKRSNQSQKPKDKMFECDICFKEFTQLAHLKTHKVIHTGERSFQCEICFKRFTRKSGLDVHKLIHSGEKSYKCEICFKRFVQPSHLKTHKLTHTGEKSFECDICFKKFGRKSGLDVHKLIHSGEKAYRCDICSKCFIQPSHLTTHKLVHTGEKPFECNICFKKFNRSALLRKHRVSHRRQTGV